MKHILYLLRNISVYFLLSKYFTAASIGGIVDARSFIRRVIAEPPPVISERTVCVTMGESQKLGNPRVLLLLSLDISSV